MEEVTIGGHVYRVGRLDARKQFHVARRLGPILAAAGGLASVAKMGEAALAPMAEGEELTADRVAAFAGMLAPLLEVLAQIPDADIDYIIDAALSVVQRQIEGGGGWAPVFMNGAQMFQDIGLPDLLSLTGRVILGSPGQGGLGDFFGERLSALRGAA